MDLRTQERAWTCCQDAAQAFVAWKKAAGDWRETAGTVASSVAGCCGRHLHLEAAEVLGGTSASAVPAAGDAAALRAARLAALEKRS